MFMPVFTAMPRPVAPTAPFPSLLLQLSADGALLVVAEVA